MAQKIKHKIKNHLIPHKHNNYQPKVITHKGLAVMLFLLLFVQVAYNFTNTGTVKVLGYATNVTESGLLEYTNQNRNNAGLDDLTINENLNFAAQKKAEHMIANNYWSHYAPDGTTPWDFINKTGYEYLKAGENLAYGFSDSSGTVQGWMDSKPHADNILDSKFTEVGFGLASSPTFQGDENTVIVAMYGQPIAGAAPVSSAPSNQDATLAWTPQDIIRNGEEQSEITVDQAPQTVSVLSAVTNGSAHWGLYASLLIITLLAGVYAIRHAVAIKQFAIHGEHFVKGHPMIEAGLIYGLLWLTLASTYGVVG